MGTQESAIGVYVTYVRKEDAARAIIAIDGSKGPDGKTIRASYGTTKYCTTYLRNLPCTNAICTYLHEPGEEADSFTKEDLSTLRHAAKDTEHKTRPTPTPASFSTASGHPKLEAQHLSSLPTAESIEASALPKTASWASGKPMLSTPGGSGSSASPGQPMGNNNAFRDHDLPPLSAMQHSSVTRKGSGNQSRVPSSPAAGKIPTAPKGRVPSAPAPAINGSGSPLTRSESPKLHTAVNAVASPLSSPARPNTTASVLPPPPPPPGLSRHPPKGPSAMQNSTQRGSARDSRPEDEKLVPPPPAPPGLKSERSHAAASPPATPTQTNGADAASSSVAASTYQPSSGAQALLDDMRSRREAESYQPTKSPFPDFDATLSSFRDGDDFCFTFEESQIPISIKESGNGAAGLSAFTPFALSHTSSSFFGRASPAPPPPPPPGIATPSRSTAASPAPPPGLFGGVNEGGTPGYTGRFDPFAPGVGEMTTTNDSGNVSSPFTAIDQMRRTVSDGRAENESRSEGKEDEEARLSRFGFSNKRRESPFFKTHDDLLGFVKGGAARMTEGEPEPQQQMDQPGDSVGWLTDLQRRATAAQLLSAQSAQTNYTMDRSSGSSYRGAASQEDPLLAQLINYRPMDGLPYHDPAIMSYTRQQQAQAQAQAQAQQQQQQQQLAPQDSYGFNPFDSQQHPAPSYRSGSNFQQPYGNYRTFA